MNFSNIFDRAKNILNITIFDNTIWRIIITILVFVAIFICVKFMIKKTKWLLQNNKLWKPIGFLESLSKLPLLFWIFIDLFIVSKFLILDVKTVNIINALFLLIVIYWTAKILVKLSWHFLWKILNWNPAWKRTIELIINILVWVLWILIFLTNIWVNLTPIIASLWVASIAIAFALQNILSDLFASFSILLSKVFVIWDFIDVWAFSGTVKSITLKSTVLENIAGQDVIIPNSTILTSNIVNYGKASFRRQRPVISVTYSTSIQHLKDIPWIIESVIKNIDNVDFEWCHFQKMNDYSLDFLCSYKCLSPDYVNMLEINEKIFLWILSEFEKIWIEMAFPTQTVYTYSDK